MFMGLVTGR